ncbi:hypothetical protein [Alteribacillus sp. YIM 98480]|uniref:hypothetical protein n=1 Tax=Alteribacillus sp. YIM 98480 TaxID=2606599 RepID=UPI00131D594B|nr:hypothetical protein [Alteribacillus sp. YIM 98480]
MDEKLHIFMEYKIIPEQEQNYTRIMKEIAQVLPNYEVEKFQWFSAADQQCLFVEIFEVPTLSHYHTLRKWRCSKSHHIFGKLDDCIEGGVQKIHCWAFQAKTDELKLR